MCFLFGFGVCIKLSSIYLVFSVISIVAAQKQFQFFSITYGNTKHRKSVYTCKFIKFSMPIVSILNMNVWWSLCDELKAKRQIYSFANAYALVGGSFVRSVASLFVLFFVLVVVVVVCFYCVSTLGALSWQFRCTKSVVYCQLYAMVSANSFYLLQIELHPFPWQSNGNSNKHRMKEALTTATSSYKRITEQMVYIVCRYNVYRICQPANSLFRKPYNEINSDKIYML